MTKVPFDVSSSSCLTAQGEELLALVDQAHFARSVRHAIVAMSRLPSAQWHLGLLKELSCYPRHQKTLDRNDTRAASCSAFLIPGRAI